jgi:hypothetical protein
MKMHKKQTIHPAEETLPWTHNEHDDLRLASLYAGIKKFDLMLSMPIARG